AERGRVAGKIRALQKFRAGHEHPFLLRLVELDDAEFRRMLRYDARVRLQGQDCVSRGQSIERSVADWLQHFFKLSRGQLLQSIRKFAREDSDILRIRAERLVKIVDPFFVELTYPVSADQLRRLIVFFEDVERAGEINTREVRLPFLSVIFIQVFAE